MKKSRKSTVGSKGDAGEARRYLRSLFTKRGYTRQPSKSDPGKKGWEIRLPVDSASELKTLQKMLSAAGFNVSKPFSKSNLYIQPIYGKDAFEWFMGKK